MVDERRYCYIDFDIGNYRSKLAVTAAFVDATDTRYGFSSKDLRSLGGSEISRIGDLISCDHEWASKAAEVGGVEIRPPRAGNRIVVKLNWEVAPLACENFSSLCSNGDDASSTSSLNNANDTGKKKSVPIGECGKPLTYKNSAVHRVIPGFVVQGGDFVFGNGSGGESIFGKKFKDERAGLLLKHDKRGILSMGNSGKNSNTSQFFITFDRAPQCDGKHVVFGEVVSGWEVLSALEDIGTGSGTPSVPVNIIGCGIFKQLETPGAGYWFDQPDDSYQGFSPIFICRPRVAVLVPSASIGEKFEKLLGATNTLMITCVENDLKDSIVGDTAVYIMKQLESFAIDAVLVAPACKKLAPVELPLSWTELNPYLSVSDVVMISKPLGCINALKKSWIGQKKFHLDV